VITFYQDFPSFHFVYNGNQVGIWPIPATTGNLISMNYKIRTRDLSQADYTTGTITIPCEQTLTTIVTAGDSTATLSSAWSLPSGTYQIVFSNNENRQVVLTNGSTAMSWTTGLTNTATSTITVNSSSGGTIIVGSTTTFVSDMANRWLQVTAPNGDNQWYQIASYVSATELILDNVYTGNAVIGATYTIGEMPLMPEDYQDLALYRSLEIYYTSIVPNKAMSELYRGLYERGYSMLEAEYGQKNTSPVLTDTDAPVWNPNLFISA
jgi:hypothetical protein